MICNDYSFSSIENAVVLILELLPGKPGACIHRPVSSAFVVLKRDVLES